MIILFSAAIAWLYFASASAQTATIAGVASVIDGDTIEIHGTRIRLSGFDTPESSAPRCGAVNVHQRAANELDALHRRQDRLLRVDWD